MDVDETDVFLGTLFAGGQARLLSMWPSSLKTLQASLTGA